MIWLIGEKGMLGRELAASLRRAGMPFLATGREVSILEEAALSDFARGKAIRWIVNCAAYTAVDQAEEDIERCTALNRDGPANLARLAQHIGASLLHLSTDHVFDGALKRPYREDDAVRPVNAYGRTKAEGERVALASCARTVIVRTAWLYGGVGPHFVTTMLSLMRERPSVAVVADQLGSPTWTGDLAAALLAILQREHPLYGIYHFTDSGETTRHGFAMEIKRLGLAYGLLDHDCEVRKLSTAQYPAKAKRPAYSVLSKEKIKAAYNVRVSDWKESLKRYIQNDLTQRH